MATNTGLNHEIIDCKAKGWSGEGFINGDILNIVTFHQGNAHAPVRIGDIIELSKHKDGTIRKRRIDGYLSGQGGTGTYYVNYVPNTTT